MVSGQSINIIKLIAQRLHHYFDHFDFLVINLFLPNIQTIAGAGLLYLVTQLMVSTRFSVTVKIPSLFTLILPTRSMASEGGTDKKN